tara:strand:- start:22418 stop:23410 length:993 start_codon:yes stop_codon:yes gene_type:complete
MIELDSITKYYGNYPAVTDISFRVEKGEILGFLGPNGAGKSTTMKIITGFVPPTEGTCSVAGNDILTNSLAARRHIGYLPETVPLYTDMTVSDYLEFMGRIRELKGEHLRKRVDSVVQICRLEEYFDTFISKLSKGFRQRVGIAQSIIHEPDVLILDEPTIGIDPIQVVETRELIKNLGGEHTLIVSTHILPEVSMICERVIIIHEGQIVAVDKPENLATRLRGTERVEIDVAGPTREIVSALEKVPGVESVNRKNSLSDKGYSSFEIEAERGLEIRSELAISIVKNKWDLLRLEALGMSLEEIFLRLTTTEDATQGGENLGIEEVSNNE